MLKTICTIVLLGSLNLAYCQLTDKERSAIADHKTWVDGNAEFMEKYDLKHIHNKRILAYTDRYGIPFLLDVRYSTSETAYNDKYYLQNNKVILIIRVNSIDGHAEKYYFVDQELKEFISHKGETITKRNQLPQEKEKETIDFINGIMAELKKQFKR